MPDKPGDPPWLVAARTYVGTREGPKEENNPTVVGWIRNFGKNLRSRFARNNDSTAWCATFVSAMLDEAGVEGTNHALARSYLCWGRPTRPRRGAICVIKKKTKGPDQGTGSRAGYHVGFLVHLSKNNIWLLGGNQRNRVSVQAFPKGRWNLAGLRWPVG